ncbi:MAG: glycosyltransferase family 87 protein [Pseudomonadota bacterium]
MRSMSAANDWLSETSRQALMTRLAVLYALLFIATTLLVTFLTPGLLNGERGVIGADFLAFYTAADMTLQGRALEAYDFAAFDAALQTRAPSEQLGMMWQYPPVMFVIIAPLALLPYKLSYWLWMAMTAGVYAFAVKRLTEAVAPDRAVIYRALALIVAAPFCVGVIINGQISLLTAALLMLAAYKPKTQWWLAGLAAGLLTVKPQLGLLIPVAFILAGAWRAFAVAALVGIALHAVSLLVFGPESLMAFFAAVSRLQADVVGSGLHTPPMNMTTVFGQLRHWGVPGEVALSLQYASAAAVFSLVSWAWWRHAADETQSLYLAALLCSGAILVTPYAYAYEMAALAPAALWLAFRPSQIRVYAPLIFAGFWLVLALRRFLPMDFVLQMPFWVSISVFGLLILARPLRATERASQLAFAPR